MKKKVLGMLLAGTLMVGAVGSYAWFTDKASVNSQIKLTMGTLDISAKEHTDGWEIVDADSEIINKSATKHFKNVRPGDSFQRKFFVSNDGTLKQNVTVKLNEELANKEITTANGTVVTFDEIFNVSYDLEASPFSITDDSEIKFELDSVYTEDEDLDTPPTSAVVLTVNLEVDPVAMDNRFNHEGNDFVEIFDFLKDNSMELITIDAEQVNQK